MSSSASSLYRARCSLLLFLVALTLSIFSTSTFAQSRRDHINSYNVIATLLQNGRLEVVEEIEVAVIAHDQIRSGIIRDLPTLWDRGMFKSIALQPDIISVTQNGVSVPVQTSYSNNILSLRIGSAQRRLNSGNYTYRIVYTIHSPVVRYEGTGEKKSWDELYWNVTGNDWTFPIKQASFMLLYETPQGERIPFPYATAEFYTGKYGQNQQNAQLLEDGGITTTQPLSSQEGLTVVYTWSPEQVLFPPLSLWQKIAYQLNISQENAILWLIPLFCIGLLFIAYCRMDNRLRHPRTVIPLFVPPNGLGAGSVATFVNRQYDGTAFTADLLQLIQQKYIRLTQSLTLKPGAAYEEVILSPNNAPIEPIALELIQYIAKHSPFQLKSKSQQDNELNEAERDLRKLQRQYEKTSSSLLSTFKKGKRNTKAELKEQFSTVQKNYEKKLEPQKGFVDIYDKLRSIRQKSNKQFINGLSTCLSYLKPTAITLYLFMLIFNFGGTWSHAFGQVLLIIFGFVLMLIAIPLLWRILFKKISKSFLFFILLIALQAFLLILPPLLPANFLCTAFVSTLIISAFSMIAPRHTSKGLELDAQIKGLQMYLETAEKKRFEEMYRQQLSIEHFEKLLPYAFALGIGKTWFNQFEKYLHLTQQSAQSFADIHDWNHVVHLQSSSTYIPPQASSLLSSIINPSRSSGGGSSSSGSSGGGFSGGGAGGGGGRGW